jgi:hypothetical protein
MVMTQLSLMVELMISMLRLIPQDAWQNELVETLALEKLMKRRANDKLTEKKDHEVLKMVKTPQMTFQS